MSAERKLDFCLDCMEDFRYDDTGGYNPPCACHAKCRGCCEADCEREEFTDPGPDPYDTDDSEMSDLPTSEGRPE